MASIIENIIPNQKFELIRDKIALILFDEIGNQKTLTNNSDLDVKVFLERFVNFDKTDFYLSLIHILLHQK